MAGRRHRFVTDLLETQGAPDAAGMELCIRRPRIQLVPFLRHPHEEPGPKPIYSPIDRSGLRPGMDVEAQRRGAGEILNRRGRTDSIFLTACDLSHKAPHCLCHPLMELVASRPWKQRCGPVSLDDWP